jgi:hypothetical protein
MKTAYAGSLRSCAQPDLRLFIQSVSRVPCGCSWCWVTDLKQAIRADVIRQSVLSRETGVPVLNTYNSF